MYKFFVFSPNNDEIIQKIISAATESGAGIVGKYSKCSFITEGMGTWLPLPGSKPTIGTLGELSVQKEVKIEMECEKEKMQDVFLAIKQIHPYDHISIDAVEITRFE